MEEKEPLLENQRIERRRTSDPRLFLTNKAGFFTTRKRLKKLKEFYENQDRLIENYHIDEQCFNKSDFDHVAIEMARNEMNKKGQRMDRLMARIIFGLNVVLLGANLMASILSHSYSVVSAFIDNAMDLTTSLIVQTSVWAINNTNMLNYPRGRERLEIVSVIVNPEATIPTISILLGGITIRIILLAICYSKSSQGCKLMGLDLRNDILTSVVALTCAVIGDRYWPLADPIGAIVVCSFIAISWMANVFSTIPLMIGRRAEQEAISRILRIAIQHDDKIKHIDHMMVYHLGERALVELHVVLDEHLPLKLTHDLTEALERKIRSLEFVERVFIHVDYQCDGWLGGH
uniref:Cation efflux protein cytoplasmic domain-containing protein n=1 Tax=Meloidogyne javanica TaxID=6303 RepID=A0A915LV56_MELJA